MAVWERAVDETIGEDSDITIPPVGLILLNQLAAVINAAVGVGQTIRV